LIDAAPGRSDKPKGNCLQTRTLEVFDDMNLVDQLLIQGHRALFTTAYVDGELKSRRSYAELDSSYPYVLWLAQVGVEGFMEQEVARHGLKVDSTVAWTGQNADQLAAGVLKFRSTGITHVFVIDPSGLETFGWMSEAESQAYRPWYAIDTRNYPFLQASQSPAGQLPKVRGIGWVPNADLGTVPPELLTGNDRRCLSTVAPARQDMADPTNIRVAFAYCDTLEFLKEAAGSAPTLSLAAIKVGGEALGDRHAAVGTFRTQFGPGRHDGATQARDLAFDAGCRCFRYSGPLFPM